MTKKKIALVVDKENWAFANIARNIKKYLSKYFELEIIPMSYLENNFIRLFLLVKDYDLIHFFWRGHLMDIKNDFFDWYAQEIGTTRQDFEKEYIDYSKITTAVYDHLFLDDKIDITNDIFNRVNNYYVSSNRLFNIYKDLALENKPKSVITDGVSLEEFFPVSLDRFNNISDRTIVIGWCGNSKWSDGTEDVKGLKTILEPAIRKLKKQKYNITTNFADSQVKMIPHNEMVNYYSKIDILVCSSKIEGTPNPVLEAMACGIPVVSTDVGIVKDVLGRKQQDYILKERSVSEMERVIKYLLDNREMFKILSEENLKSIKKMTWQEISKKFKNFFDECLNNKEVNK